VTQRFAISICALLACGVLAACGSDSGGGSSSGGGGSSGSQQNGATSGAKVIDPASMDSAKGNVTYCTGKDTSGAQIKSVADFNKKFASQGLKAKLLEFPESADEQRNQFKQRQQAKSGDCDIFYSDVIWTAEFASQKWLYDMTPYIQKRQSEFIPSTFGSVKFDNKYFGVPKQTDAAFVYYRTDQADAPPSTWQQMYADGAKKNGTIYQGAAYEGLTVHFLELAFAAGGKALSDDGKKSEINSPENVKALQFMVDGLKSGAVPKAVTTYMEEQSRRAFEAGKATYQRQWPYAYAKGQDNPKVKGKFKVVPLPAFEGGGKAGILGGHNLVVSAYSKNPAGASS